MGALGLAGWLLSACVLCVPAWAQSLTKEYIHLGGRVIAIEPGLVITAVQATSVTSNTAVIQWTTDVASDSQVVYGTTTSYGNQTTVNPTLVASHSVSLAGLQASTTYHFKVKSARSGGADGESSDYTFATTSSGVVISNVQATGVTASAATIQWATNLSSDSQVIYGTTTAYGSQTTVNPTLETSHSASLAGLTASTIYHYKVRSAASGGSAVESPDYTFTTSAPPLTISNVQVVGVTANGATIQWTTNVAANSQVEYGLTTSYGSQTVLDTTLATNHSVTLSGLSASTLYHFKVKSAPSGGAVVGSPDSTFTTSAASGLIISSVQAVGVTSGGATIQWTTNVGGSSQVNYGLTTSYGMNTVLDSNLMTTHRQLLSGLSPGTTYHYRVVSAPQSGGSVTSGDNTFSTVSTLAVATSAGATTAYLNLGQSVQFNAYLNGSTTPSNTSVTWTANPSNPVLVVQDGPGLFRSVNSNPTYTSVTVTASLNSNPAVTATATILLNPNSVSQSLWMEPNPASRLAFYHWVVQPGMQAAEWYSSQYMFIGTDLNQPETGCELETTPNNYLWLYVPGGSNLVSSSPLSTFFGTAGTATSMPALTNARCRATLNTAEAYVLFNGNTWDNSTDRILALPSAIP